MNIRADRALNRIFIVLLVLILGGIAAAGWWASQAAAPEVGGVPSARPAAAGVAQDGPRNRSLAVLPFTARGIRSEHGRLFTDGLHDELLQRISRMAELRVIARKSVMDFRNTTKSIIEIGEELGASHVLECSLQRAGARIRIDARLLNASTGRAAWAENFDREISVANLVDIQQQIAQSVGEHMGATLSGVAESAPREPATSRLEAYRAVLVSRQFSLLRSPGSLRNAVDQARKAVAADPGYADAYLALAQAEARRVELDLATDAEQGETIRAALDHALELAPDHPQAWSIRGRYLWLGRKPAALPTLERAMRLDPGNLTAVFAYGRALRETDRPDRALPLLRHVADRDPRSAEAMLALGRTLSALGEHDEARQAFDRVRELNPDGSPGYGPHSASYMAEGKLDEALFWAVRTQELTPRSSDAGAWVLFLNDCLEDYGAAGEWSSWLGRRVTNQPLPLAMLARHDFLTGQFQSAIQRSNLALRLGRPGNAVADAVFMRIKRDEALALGAPDEAIRLFRERRPELFDKPPRLSPDNVQQAVDLAQLLQMAGRRDTAHVLLERAIEWYEQPFSVAGNDRSWLVPVKAEALAILGRHGEALAELRRIVDAGWRVFWRWETDLNFNFNELRNSPEFREMIRELAEDMAKQRRQAQAMAGLGEMSPPSGTDRKSIP